MNGTIQQLPRLGIAGAMRLFGLSARALRFYEERGLIEARRDRLNTRYYDVATRERLAWIARLRRAGVALLDVQEVLEAEGPAARASRAIDKLQHRRALVLSQLAAIEDAVAELHPPKARQGHVRTK